MSSCNIVTIIPSNQCIGDSLRTINTNFVALDSSVCSIPTTIGDGKKVKALKYKDELGFEKIQVTTKQTSVLQKTFEAHTPNVSACLIETSLGLSSLAYNFPYESSALNQKPLGTFNSISFDNGYPQLTLYWTGSVPQNNKTIFALNSSVSLYENGTICPDGTVNCFYEDANVNLLYIGGEFNNINSAGRGKFAVINLSGGNLLPDVGSTGSVLLHPLSGFGEYGSVNFITKTITKEENTGVQHELLIVAGDFKSESLGRSLVIRDETTKINYPFYFNGPIYNGIVKDSYLYVVGYFDFVNFGISYETSGSGFRVYSKSIAKISLTSLRTSPNNCVDKDFAKATQAVFAGSCKINCIDVQEELFYIGGEFEVKDTEKLLHKNILAITTNCMPIDTWKLIINGPVHTIIIDNPLSVLYIGGEFSRILTTSQYYSEVEQPLSEETRFFNAAAFSLDIPKLPLLLNWKPRFNGTVAKLVVHNSFTDSWIYAAGKFTQINESAVSFIAALTKATDEFNNNDIGKLIRWKVQLSSGFSEHTNGLLVSNGNLFIGGSFNKINNNYRFNFGKVIGVEESVLKIYKQINFASFL